MTDWFTFCGFDPLTEALVFEETRECPVDAVKAALKSSDISDDPEILNCYEIDRDSVQALIPEKDLPEAEYFVNATQAPSLASKSA